MLTDKQIDKAEEGERRPSLLCQLGPSIGGTWELVPTTQLPKKVVSPPGQRERKCSWRLVDPVVITVCAHLDYLISVLELFYPNASTNWRCDTENERGKTIPQVNTQLTTHVTSPCLSSRHCACTLQGFSSGFLQFLSALQPLV